MLAYATTAHKAQGREYPAVVIPLTTQYYPMLQRILICTGITRGRKLVVPVGQKKALAMAVRGPRIVPRWSKPATGSQWGVPMDAHVLTDRNEHPSEERIFSHLGKRRTLWEALFAFIHAEHPDFAEQWRYYNDGKCWLLNVSRRKRTVFWLSVISGTFRITGYFTDKAADAIRASPLSDELKEQFLSGARYGKLRAITITFKKKRDVEDARVLVALKTA